MSPNETSAVYDDDLPKRVQSLRVEAEALSASAEYFEKIEGEGSRTAHDLRTHAKALRYAADYIAEFFETPF